MSADPTTPESDNLRRSKRKKFKLDVVAAAHGNNQRKSKKDPHGEDDDDDDTFEQLSVMTDMPDLSDEKEEEPSDYEEEDTLSKRRTRRSTAHWGDYQDPFVDWVDQAGAFACSKCPSRYESRSSLSNHSKMHNGEKRKFACELCDFSSSTQKSLMHHNNIHKRFGVISAQTSPVINQSPDNANNNAPQLTAATEEPFCVAEDDDVNRTHDSTPPPILEREASMEPLPPLLERAISPSPSPSIKMEEPPKKVAIRKSNRPAKPSLKRTPISTPKVTNKYKKIKLNNSRLSTTPPPGSLSNSATPSTSSSERPSEKSTPDLTPESKPDKEVSTDVCEAVFNAEKGRKLRKCPHCPFTATSLTRMNRHSGGHNLKEGFVCPVKSCNYMCRTAGFLQRHYTVHKGALPWPPKFAKRGETVEKENKKELIVKAQIRSYRKVPAVDNVGVLVRGCNAEGCNFETTSQTQLIIHKTKIHAAKSLFPSHPFLCFTCGHRAKTYSALRVHKLTSHVSTKLRYHRTFYLKELIGDRFFVKYYAGRSYSDYDEESGDDASTDSGSMPVLPGDSINAGKPLSFCCNLCPYQGRTISRCRRHHTKHFVQSRYNCRHCSWSTRTEEVLLEHENLHRPPGAKLADDTTETLVPIPTAVEIFKCPDTRQLGESLRNWSNGERAARPEIDEHFIRKIIDGQKGFQCIDCPYTSKYRGDMRSHKKRHDIEQMYRCVQCTYTTNRPVSLKDHMKQHVPANMSQIHAVAKEVVVNQGVHIGVRRGLGKNRIYCCNKCPYVTLALGCLWRHHRNHRETAKFYICSNCSYSSIDMRKMEEHTVIHTALGINEQMPFVKRVDQEGNPVSSLTDPKETNAERKNKRKLVLDEKSKEKLKPEKKRKTSNESTPTADSPMPVLVKQEKTPKFKMNSSPSAKENREKTPVHSSSVSIEQLEEPCVKETEEFTEVSHFRIRKFLCKEKVLKETHKCPECPYKCKEEDLLSKHLFFHMNDGVPRPYTCTDCTFTTFTPTALLHHLKLHGTGVPYDPLEKRLPKSRKGDTIPNGSKGYHCKTCSFKTPNERAFIEHCSFHRYQLVNRINVSMKRQPPKEEYQRPKMKHLFVARNAKYCKKCTFKCVSQSSFIEHVDRHGWDQLYRCHICDYSDNNKSVVDFHAINHHIMRDQALHNINVAAKFQLDCGEIQKPECEVRKPTVEEFAKMSRNLLKCASCDYFCHVASELAFHMSINHSEEPGARQVISYLHMGLLPPQATITKV